MSASASEKRRLPRFHITPSQFHDEALKKIFSVQDISMGGMAIRLVEHADLPEFLVGSEHHGTIKIEGMKYNCTFQVRYLRGLLVGVQWVNLEQPLQEQIEQMSLPKTLGSNLKAYDLPDSPNTLWYHNPIGVDLLLYLNDARINRWTLFIHQNYLSWDEGADLKTGCALAEDEEGYAHGIVRLETRLLNDDEQLDHRLIETAVDMVKNAPFKEESIRHLLLNQLQGVQSS